jgi:CheY-like chemotaxis protein
MYDVIILDLNMPISDGFDACLKIRQLYESVKFFQKANNQSEHSSSTLQLLKELKPLIIACSSDDMESPLMKRRLEEAGFDYAISSPLTAKYVKEILTV